MAARSTPESFGALRHPLYRTYFITGALAMMGDNIEHVISYCLLDQRIHSPTLAGVAVLTHWLPFLLFSVYAGALADGLTHGIIPLDPLGQQRSARIRGG